MSFSDARNHVSRLLSTVRNQTPVALTDRGEVKAYILATHHYDRLVARSLDPMSFGLPGDTLSVRLTAIAARHAAYSPAMCRYQSDAVASVLLAPSRFIRLLESTEEPISDALRPYRSSALVECMAQLLASRSR